MKFYVGSGMRNGELVNDYVNQLKKNGWQQTYDWVKNISADVNIDDMRNYAKLESLGIMDSDVVIILLPAGRGAHIELGMAMAANKRIFLCSTIEEEFSIENTVAFYELPTITKLVGTASENIAKILTLSDDNHKNQRKGDWQETYTGKFYAADPQSREVNLQDIAHGLSQICRFTGQCRYFYSVAQHCLNVYRDLRQLGYDDTIQLIGLLHDASEAYTNDLSKPFKVEIPQYKVFEESIERAIYDKFHLPFPNDEIHKIIKFSDNEVLYNEVERLMNNVENWTKKYPHRKLNIDTGYRNMKEVEQEYLDTARRLIKKRDKRR